MNQEELSQLNEKYAKESELFFNDFINLWKKWFDKSPRLSIVNTLHLPINLIMNMVDKGLPECVPDLPDMMERFLMPFILLKDVYGKIPAKEFRDKYRILYESNWDKVGVTEEDRKRFKEWYDRDTENRIKKP